jgi:hypothetical protein
MTLAGIFFLRTMTQFQQAWRQSGDGWWRFVGIPYSGDAVAGIPGELRLGERKTE